MNAPFRFVIVGTGNISKTYAVAIAAVDDAEIAGIVSRSGRCPAPLEGTAVPVAMSPAELTVDFDAVVLTTPNGLHHQGAIEAAALGKHVLTEKVLDITREHMDVMIDTCRKAGVTLGVAFQRRMSGDNPRIKRLLDEGALGRIHAADVYAKFWREQSYYDSAPYRGGREIDGGGPFMQQAAHQIDLYCWFFGLPVKVVGMLDTFRHEMESEDHGTALMRHANGMIGTIAASTATNPGYPARMEIHAEKGTVVLENDRITVWDITGIDRPADTARPGTNSGASSAAIDDTAAHEAIIADFIDAARTGREPAVSAESARMATELVLRIYEAAA